MAGLDTCRAGCGQIPDTYCPHWAINAQQWHRLAPFGCHKCSFSGFLRKPLTRTQPHPTGCPARCAGVSPAAGGDPPMAGQPRFTDAGADAPDGRLTPPSSARRSAPSRLRREGLRDSRDSGSPMTAQPAPLASLVGRLGSRERLLKVGRRIFPARGRAAPEGREKSDHGDHRGEGDKNKILSPQPPPVLDFSDFRYPFPKNKSLIRPIATL